LLLELKDARLRSSERAAVLEHLGECSECRSYERQIRSASMALRESPRLIPPQELTYRLRVIASHERARVDAGIDWLSAFRFRLNQLLRPLLVPAAGGLFMSLLFFAVLTPSFTVHAGTSKDVPVGLFTQVAMISPSPFGFNGTDVTVEVTIDESGAVADYTVPGGSLSKDEMRDVGNFILFSSFKAATKFGQPVTSKLLLNIRHIDVRS
jgi:hypothetical protein